MLGACSEHAPSNLQKLPHGFARELYQDVILDHHGRPRNRREMPDASAKASGHNPLCGDRVTVFVEDGRRRPAGRHLRRHRLRHLAGLGLDDDRLPEGPDAQPRSPTSPPPSSAGDRAGHGDAGRRRPGREARGLRRRARLPVAREVRVAGVACPPCGARAAGSASSRPNSRPGRAILLGCPRPPIPTARWR